LFPDAHQEKKKKAGEEKKTDGDHEKKNEEEKEGEEGAAKVRYFNVPFKSLENMHISSVCFLWAFCKIPLTPLYHEITIS